MNLTEHDKNQIENIHYEVESFQNSSIELPTLLKNLNELVNSLERTGNEWNDSLKEKISIIEQNQNGPFSKRIFEQDSLIFFPLQDLKNIIAKKMGENQSKPLPVTKRFEKYLTEKEQKSRKNWFLLLLIKHAFPLVTLFLLLLNWGPIPELYYYYASAIGSIFIASVLYHTAYISFGNKFLMLYLILLSLNGFQLISELPEISSNFEKIMSSIAFLEAIATAVYAIYSFTLRNVNKQIQPYLKSPLQASEISSNFFASTSKEDLLVRYEEKLKKFPNQLYIIEREFQRALRALSK